MRSERARVRVVASLLGALVLLGFLSVATGDGTLPGWLAPRIPAAGGSGIASLPAPSGPRIDQEPGAGDQGGRPLGVTVGAGTPSSNSAVVGGSTDLPQAPGQAADAGSLSAANCAGVRPLGAPPPWAAASRYGRRVRGAEVHRATATLVDHGARIPSVWSAEGPMVMMGRNDTAGDRVWGSPPGDCLSSSLRSRRPSRGSSALHPGEVCVAGRTPPGWGLGACGGGELRALRTPYPRSRYGNSGYVSAARGPCGRSERCAARRGSHVAHGSPPGRSHRSPRSAAGREHRGRPNR
jgi:hypothetical protein